MANMNRQIVLAARPEGMPKPSDFRLVETPVPKPTQGQFLVKTNYLSVDPYMRGRISEAKSYAEPVQIGQVMVGGTVGTVVESQHPSYRPGEVVVGYWGWQEHAVSDGQGIQRFDTSLAPMSTALGVLGMPGMTAYFGLLDICQPKEGETVVVSGAAGAVGSLVGQIARITGCRVVGIAGGADKCRYLTEELGFDASIDYKGEDVREALKRHAPKGVDVYFDNVGGEILDIVLSLLARKARISICGAISQYNNLEGVQGPGNYLSLLVNSARMEGFIVFNYAARYAEGVRAIAGWLAEGKIKAREDVVDGLETFPETLLMLFRGENLGKLVIRVAGE